MRYLPLTDEDRRAMLRKIGAASVDALFGDVPPSVNQSADEALPGGMSEISVERALMSLAARNLSPSRAPCFLGAGAYRHHIPASVDHLIQRGEFMTAYTPYQPEIAQGTLQALFEFQTQTAILTALDIANASIYDGATACAEAVLMAHRMTKRPKAILSSALHPHYAQTTRTLSEYAQYQTTVARHQSGDFAPLIKALDGDTAALVVQNPDLFGAVADLTPLAAAAHEAGALLIYVFNETVSLGLLRAPGDVGADIAAGEGQSLGNPLSFGGPYVGLLAARAKCLRQMPGRLCGMTEDAEGRAGFVLTLAAREQHIRRERATSNICTNAGLCALAFSCHLTLLGGEGLYRLAKINHARARSLAKRLSEIKHVRLTTPLFFNEFTLETPIGGAELMDALAEKGILGGVPLSRLLPDEEARQKSVLVAATEMNSEEECALYAEALAACLS